MTQTDWNGSFTGFILFVIRSCPIITEFLFLSFLPPPLFLVASALVHYFVIFCARVCVDMYCVLLLSRGDSMVAYW